MTAPEIPAPRSISQSVIVKQRRSTPTPASPRVSEPLALESVLLTRKYALQFTDLSVTVRQIKSTPTHAWLRAKDSKRLADVKRLLSPNLPWLNALMPEESFVTAKPSDDTLVSVTLRRTEPLAYSSALRNLTSQEFLEPLRRPGRTDV